MLIDLGDNHTIRFKTYKGDNFACAEVTHLKPDGTVCESFISIRGGAWSSEFPSGLMEASWELVSCDPVTLSPSLACRVCGDHGFIQNGKWVKA